MSKCNILAWPALLRPPLPTSESPAVPKVPLKALTCRNQTVSLAALITSNTPIDGARFVVSDLVSRKGAIPSDRVLVRLVGTVPTPEAGLVCDPLYEVEEFRVERSATLHIRVSIPKGIPAGIYRGSVGLVANGEELARNRVEIQVANVSLPDARDRRFFLSVWMNPAAVARWHGAEVWSEDHFRFLWPYVADLAAHGQKTAVVPICYRPWGAQTRDPYPSAVIWKKRGDIYEFDFSVFDRYIRLHEECGIDRAIHCYSIVQGPGETDESTIEYIDAETGRTEQLRARVGDAEYVKAWGAFFTAFRVHLARSGRLSKTYIGFDEKPPEVTEKLVSFLNSRAPEFKIALAGNTRDDLFKRLDDLSLAIPFDERGVAESVPMERATTGMADLLNPDNIRAAAGSSPEKSITTFYTCCIPEYPNTFVHSPLVESRMLPFLAIQGGFDGYLRWAYNDWPDNPFEHPEWGTWPTGDTFLVYPGERGPVSSLRWEQLLEGIFDFDLAAIASANFQTPEEMIDYEQAITLACRNVDGRTKSIGDVEIARRLLIPIAEHASTGR